MTADLNASGATQQRRDERRERRERRDRAVALWRSGAATAEQVASDLNNQLSSVLAELDRIAAERDALLAKIARIDALLGGNDGFFYGPPINQTIIRDALSGKDGS